MASFTWSNPAGNTGSRPLARLAAVATLAAFLIAQSSILCAPLCLLEGHAKAAMAESHSQNHLMHCHPDKVRSTELPVIPLLGSMLPVEPAQLLPTPRVVSVPLASPVSLHLQQIPPAEPPPPRPV